MKGFENFLFQGVIGAIVASFLFGSVKAATIGYWTAEGNSAASSVAGLTSTASGTVSYTSNTVGPMIYDPISGNTRANDTAFNFSGGNAQISIADSTLLDQSKFTWEFFINLQGQPNSWDAFLTRKASSLGYQIDFDNSNSSAFGNVRTRWDTSPTSQTTGNNMTVAGGKIYTDSDSDLKVDVTNSQALPWHHVAVTWDATTDTVAIWTDYTLNNTRVLSGPVFDTNWLAGVLFGKLNSNSYELYMDEIRFSDDVLTSAQFLRAVPEPSKALLLCLSISALIFRRRR